MSQQLRFKPRKPRANPMATRRLALAFDGSAAATAAVDFPGLALREPEDSRRTWITGGMAAALHFGVLGFLLLLASLAPQLVEDIIPVRLIKEEPPPKSEEPAPAPKALAERRFANFAPQVQTVAPQIINPRVIAEAAPAVSADVLHMDAVTSVVAPRQITRSSAPVVERVSAVNSPIRARASAVDVGVAGPAVRGPIKIDAPVGPSVGPRKVDVASTVPSMGTGKLDIGGSGSSVREGVISNRDVVGSPSGAPLVSIDTAVGEGTLRGSGGTGSSVMSQTASECLDRPEVRGYLEEVQKRTLDRWILPPGIQADNKVTLRFQLDVGGSAISVSLVRASNNALGASAVDALNAAAPFPALPNRARCLARVPITATFSNPVAG
jgi:TonB family protein